MSSSLKGEQDSRSTESSSIQAKERLVAAPEVFSSAIKMLRILHFVTHRRPTR